MKISEQLTRNHTAGSSGGQLATPREGSALLQGRVICGKCGRRMSPRYYGTSGQRASYECNQQRKQDGQVGICWTVAAAAIDAAVEAHVLEAITQENLDISLAVLNELDQQAAELEHQWQLRLERGRYEAERAERQFDAVEPENRLVSRTLERRWNEKLQQLTELEQAYVQAAQIHRLEISEPQRQQILRLANDIPAVWFSPTTTAQERKEMLSLLVKQVAITPIDQPQRQTHIAILWHTGAITKLVATRPTTQEKLRTSEQVVQSVRELAAGRTDSEIATELNQRGLLSGRGRTFTTSAVAWIRWKFQIDKPGSDPGFARRVGIRSDGSYSTSAKRRKIGSRDSHHPLLAGKGNS